MLFLHLLQDATPDTSGYMLLGYAFLLGLPLLYIISWYVRRRNLERDLEMIETLAKEEKEKPAARAAASATPPDGAQKPTRP